MNRFSRASGPDPMSPAIAAVIKFSQALTREQQAALSAFQTIQHNSPDMVNGYLREKDTSRLKSGKLAMLTTTLSAKKIGWLQKNFKEAGLNPIVITHGVTCRLKLDPLAVADLYETVARIKNSPTVEEFFNALSREEKRVTDAVMAQVPALVGLKSIEPEVLRSEAKAIREKSERQQINGQFR